MDTPETVEKKPESAEAPKPAPEAEAAQAASAKAASEVYAKPEAPKSEAAAAEAAKPEAAATEAPKPEVPKPEEAKAEAPKPEAPKADAPAAAPSTDTKAAAAPTDKAPEKNDKDFGDGDIWSKISSDTWSRKDGLSLQYTKDTSKSLHSDEEWEDYFADWDTADGATAPTDSASIEKRIESWFDSDSAGDRPRGDRGRRHEFNADFKIDKDQLKYLAKGVSEEDAKAVKLDSLPEGVKVDENGKVELSEDFKRQLAEDPEKAIVHTFKDSHGQDVTVEISNGKLVHKTDDKVTVITDDRVLMTDEHGNTREVDKKTGKVTVKNNGETFEQQGDARKITRADGTREEYDAKTGKVTRYDANGKVDRVLGPHEIRIRLSDHVSYRHRRSQSGPDTPPPRDEWTVTETEDGVRFEKPDENMKVDIDRKGRAIVHHPDGSVYLLGASGKLMRRTADGQEEPVGKDDLPRGFVAGADGKVELKLRDGFCFRGGRMVDSEGAQYTVGANGKLQATDAQGRTAGVETEGDKIVVRTFDGKQDVIDPKEGTVKGYDENGKPTYDYNSRSREYTSGGTTFTPEGTKLANGDFVSNDGTLRTADGDVVDRYGNVAFADGTTVDADGHVRTGDGKELDVPGMGQAKSPEATAAYAITLASAIAGKSDISPADIAALQALLGQMGSQLQSLTNLGAMDAFAKVKSAEGTVMVALAHAQSKQGQTAPANQGTPNANQPNQNVGQS